MQTQTSEPAEQDLKQKRAKNITEALLPLSASLRSCLPQNLWTLP